MTPEEQRLLAVQDGSLARRALCLCKDGDYGPKRAEGLPLEMVDAMSAAGFDLNTPCPFCNGTRVVCAACMGMGFINGSDDDVTCPICAGTGA